MTYKKYISKIKKKKRTIVICRLFILISFVFLWQLLADKNYINTFITSSPKNIILSIINLYNHNNLLFHIWITIKEVLLSFTITSILSILIAILFYNHNILYKILDPFITLFNSLPKVALGPIIIIWIGANTKSIITISILISIIVSMQTIYNSFENTDKLKIKLLKSFNATKKDILIYAVIPSNKSVILSTLKINISMCLIGVITGEFLTSKAGIGYLILYGSQVFNLNLVMSGIFLLMIISYIMYNLVLYISKR